MCALPEFGARVLRVMVASSPGAVSFNGPVMACEANV